MIHVCVCFALPRAIDLHDYFIGNVFVYPTQKRGNLIATGIAVRLYATVHKGVRAKQKLYLRDVVFDRSNQPCKRITMEAAVSITIISTYLCEFYSIPNSPRGGKRENGSTLLQTVLH